MRVCTAELQSISAYGQSKYYQTPRLEKETHADYEKRTWRDRLHETENGFVFMPPMAFKHALSTAARMMGIQIPGRGKANYTKHFDAGILVPEGPVLPIKKDNVEGTWLMLPADGRAGGSKRVMKCMPTIPSWEVKVRFVILDDTITKDIFEKHLNEAGNFVGVGYFRPERRGYWGRFKVNSFTWEE